MTNRTFLFLSLFLYSTYFIAQQSSVSSSEILLQIQKLNTLGKVLYIAAHPDDENTRLLAYLANEKKFRTAYLSITRGDGGQNLIGKEQGPLLGVLRTQELLAARRIDKAEQYFTHALDFGYSKLAEETFATWNRKLVLADVVYVIREFQPDVIICRFPTTGEGGHGHHTASAILAKEAFDAAADSSQFPEQLKRTQVWKAKRLFWNTFNFGNTNTTSPNQLQMDVGSYNAALGKSYGEIASESRSCHKSQGFGVARQRGKNIEYFKQLKGDSVSKDIFEGISTSWLQFAGTEPIQNILRQCISEFDALAPEKSLPLLMELYKNISNLDENQKDLAYWKKIKLKEVESLLLSCSGLWVEAGSTDYQGIPGTKTQINAQVVLRNKCQVQLQKISFFNQSDTVCDLALEPNLLYTFKHNEIVSKNLPYSTPYWLKEPDANTLAIEPERAGDTKVTFHFNFNGIELKITRQLVYKYTDPVKGEVYRPFEILPPATVNLSEKNFVFVNGEQKSILFTIKSNAENVKGLLKLHASKNWKVQMKNAEFTLEKKGDELVLEAQLSCSAEALEGELKASLVVDGQEYDQSISRIEYDHVPYQFILSAAKAKLLNCDIKTKKLQIGYIEGAGDEIPAALKQLGFEVTLLSDELLSNTKLNKYQAIVTGVRAYNTNKGLQSHYNTLMEYVRQGGNLIVQYNTNNNLGPIKTKIGPYPFTISRERVTDENAQVQFTSTKHPVFNYPNALSAADFDNWVQERGIYFATAIDSNYVTPLSMHDPGETEKTGSLLVAAYGKGNFVYTGLAFFRQLPAGVPGAYRLFVNLLNLPKH